MSKLFGGQFFDRIMQQEPLQGATFFDKGSSTMLFQKDGHLYRLTREGCGHVLMANESANGNPGFMKVIQDYGPVAPSDEGDDEFYWLAEVELLEPIDALPGRENALAALLSHITNEEELIEGDDLTDLIAACAEALYQHPEFAGLLRAIMVSAEFAIAHQATADVKPSNVMVRASTGDLVLIDPIAANYVELSSDQEIAVAKFLAW